MLGGGSRELEKSVGTVVDEVGRCWKAPAVPRLGWGLDPELSSCLGWMDVSGGRDSPPLAAGTD